MTIPRGAWDREMTSPAAVIAREPKRSDGDYKRSGAICLFGNRPDQVAAANPALDHPTNL
jgi:hypothetical protein